MTQGPSQNFVGGNTHMPVGTPRRRASGGEVLLNLAVAGGFLVALAGAVFLIAAGAGAMKWESRSEVRLVGYICLALVLTLGPIALLLARAIGKMGGGRAELEARVSELGRAVRALSDQAVLSDDARRLLNRRGERELLCRAIEEDIAAEDWDAAIVLCTELADRFGYRAEAEQFRTQIDKARSVVQERRVADAIAQLDGLIVQRKWDQALKDAARITRLYPDSPRSEGLRTRVERARAVYKADLERRFLDAAGQDRVEEAMELLRELDAYLSDTEAAPYREVARGVIGKARENLGVQFKIAVQDRQWVSAAAIGRRIVNEFPNTRMAAEVREHLDGILVKANGGV